MPEWLHKKVVKSAKKKKLKPGSDRFNAYVYSVLNKYKKGKGKEKK